jgi:hypothetical protein
MSYLDRLRDFSKRPDGVPTKPTKPGFDGFVGRVTGVFQNFTVPTTGCLEGESDPATALSTMPAEPAPEPLSEPGTISTDAAANPANPANLSPQASHDKVPQLSEPGPALPVFIHVACSACMHLDDGHCEKRGFFPIYPHLAIRLCGDYEAR